MNKNIILHFCKLIFTTGYYLLVAFPIIVFAAEATLQWDANDPPPEGYRLFVRQAGGAYNYLAPVWTGHTSTHTVQNLNPGVTYFFVVRAYEGQNESGNSNEVEYTAAQISGNTSPQTPAILGPVDGTTVTLTPDLSIGGYFDADGDAHGFTQYQIATENNFAAECLVYNHFSDSNLTGLRVPDLILDPETEYFWRARVFDVRDGVSSWSAARLFVTVDYDTAGDGDGDGVFDSQVVDRYTDLDGDGTPDIFQEGILSVNTPDNTNPKMAVKRNSDNFQVVAVKAYSPGGFGLEGNRPQNLTGLISFKLHLDPGVTSAGVTVIFSNPAPAGALWYKYDPEEGWSVYPSATFAADRRSVTITLEDGGDGDQDGVRNGVIVDPAGLGYSNTGYSISGTGAGAGAAGCFIAASLDPTSSGNGFHYVLLALMSIALCGLARRMS